LRKRYMETVMKKMGIQYQFVVAKPVSRETYMRLSVHFKEYMSIGELGCLLSHLWCLRHAVRSQWATFAVFEDDVVFHKHFHSMFSTAMHRVSSPDFLMLGACDFDFVSKHQSRVENGMYTCDPSSTVLYGGHANVYSCRSAEYIYNTRRNYLTFFDYRWCDIFAQFPDTSGVCFPNIVYSDYSTTHLNHPYSPIDKSEKTTAYFKQCLPPDFSFADYHYICLGLVAQMSSQEVETMYDDNKDAPVPLTMDLTFFDIHAIRSILLHPDVVVCPATNHYQH